MTRVQTKIIKDPGANSGSTGFGIVPIGAVVPVMSNLAGSINLPVSGTVSSDGWIRCDGAVIPSGNVLSGTTPDLTGSTFIAGVSGVANGIIPNDNNAAGMTGGGNSKNSAGGSASWNSVSQGTTFTQPSVPGHYHSSAGAGSAISLTTTADSHSHTGTTNIQLSGTNAGNTSSASAGNGTGGVSGFALSTGSDSHSHTVGSWSLSLGLVTGGSLGNSSIATTGGAASFNKNVMNTDQVAHSHAIADSRPKFITAVYLMRVS